jgi:hypothetical protein
MADVIKFPGAPADRPFADPEAGGADTDIEALHAEAFRDLEGKISDCTIMAIIALQMAEPFINTRNDEAERALFAVCHVYEMLKKLSADYQAAFYGEQRGAS